MGVVWALVIAGAIGIGVVVLAGGDDDEPSAGTRASDTVSPSADGRTIDDFYGQKAHLERLRRRRVRHPRGPDQPTRLRATARSRLAVERTQATGKRIGSLVVNPGGPGAGGTYLAEQADSYFAPEPARGVRHRGLRPPRHG
ncbi:hypothetical protein G5V59_15350 [Nocardioides sp. W3-2-3]|uniref:hypothetical protein n=1 Tax=Nocardioides convexus TaxID=2712224 RepID=UPI0024183A0A|nr:hypothetical protein [Nocardioides convexus]NHA00838.1 hypothetical protein [Nocardioides convexus]